jgi:4-amino-4-deoxy-L-arabinose transferase-like glycosyltransferase
MSREAPLLVAALILFVALAAYQLALPGLHYDEAFEAVPAMQLLLHQPVTTFRGHGFMVAGRLFPVMTQDYIGAINTYATIPFFLLFGISTLSLRTMAIVMGLVTLWLAFRLARALFGPEAGLLATLLLAVNPSFVFWSRQGVFVTSVTAAIGLGAALAWLYWWRTGSSRYALLGALLLGLGLYAKFLFVWFIVALALAALLLNYGRWRDVLTRLRREPLGWYGLAFLLGSVPLLAYNLQTGGTLKSVGDNLTVSYYGTNNLAFFPNLLERLGQFAAVITGSHFWYLGKSYANWMNLILFCAAFGVTAVLAVRRGGSSARRALFPFVIIILVILASCATVSALWVTHFAVLAPWPPIAIAGAASLLLTGNSSSLQAGGRVNPGLILAVAVIGACWLGDLVTDVRYHQALASSGGLGAHSDAVEDLARWLETGQRADAPVAAMDWGIAASVSFLTLGDVSPVEAFGYEWETDADFAARLQGFIANPASIYVWRAPDEIIFDRGRDFKKLYEPYSLEEDILEAFYERSGRPVLGTTRLVPAGTAINPPRPINP